MSDTPEIRFAPRNDASHEEVCCGRCGSSVEMQRCEECNGDGDRPDDGSDPGSYRTDFGFVQCHACDGEPMWYRCLSSVEWCNAHPIPGRESIERGKIEWFDIESAPPTPEHP